MRHRIYLLLLFLAVVSSLTVSAQDSANGNKSRDAVIFNGTHVPRLVECEPEGWYYYETRMVTIEFPATGFEPYTLSVESTYNTLDYYVTTPFMSIYISPDVVDVNLYLETDGGDLYWGSFEATAAGSME